MLKQISLIISVIAVLTASGAALAASQTIVLEVPGMTCAACPVTVKKALGKLSGVTDIKTDLDKKQVVVSFEDSKTTLQKLTEATANAGYPSTVKGSQ
jgi:mercuric ion binding protein